MKHVTNTINLQQHFSQVPLTFFIISMIPLFYLVYTGFCPDIADHIGYNYHKATGKIMKVHPHVKTRLSSVSYPSNMERYECESNSFCCDVPPEYVPNYQKDIVSGNAWHPCQGDGHQSYYNTHPEKAYSLECSEWGSPCVTKHCNEIYAPCIRTNSYCCQDHIMIPPKIASVDQAQQTDSKISESSCCNSCVKGGSCNGDSSSVSKYPRKKSEYCCNSCAQGGRCIGDTKKGSSVYKYPGKRTFPSRKMMGYREEGVIPNYMGHIPGMQHSFGESYGIASCRLLRRHFDELSRRNS